MTEIKWEAPPADGRGRGRYDEVAGALRARPEQWALVAEDAASSMVTAIKKGRIAPFAPAGSFEARGQVVGKNRSRIWARYIGVRE